MTQPDTISFFAWLITENGYRDPRSIAPGRRGPRYAAIFPKLHTHAIITGDVGDRLGIGDCWCYLNYPAAKAALDAWDGTGEPQGWIRHPWTGRRISFSPDEYDEHGNQLGAAGISYVRS